MKKSPERGSPAPADPRRTWNEVAEKFRSPFVRRFMAVASGASDPGDPAMVLSAALRRMRKNTRQWDTNLIWGRAGDFGSIAPPTTESPKEQATVAFEPAILPFRNELSALAQRANQTYGLPDIGNRFIERVLEVARERWPQFPYQERTASHGPWVRDIMLDMMVAEADHSRTDLHNGGLASLNQACEEHLPRLLRMGHAAGASDRIAEFMAQVYETAARKWHEFENRTPNGVRHWFVGLANVAAMRSARATTREGLSALPDVAAPCSISVGSAMPASAADERTMLQGRAMASLGRLASSIEGSNASATFNNRTSLELTLIGDLLEVVSTLSMEHRVVWCRRVILEQSASELSDSLGEQKQTISTRLSRARSAIDERLAALWANSLSRTTP